VRALIQDEELDELAATFTSDDYSFVSEFQEGLIESGFDYTEYEEAIDDWYGMDIVHDYNKIRNHFVYFYLYKMVNNDEKALQK
jgi:hypothetical protein